MNAIKITLTKNNVELFKGAVKSDFNECKYLIGKALLDWQGDSMRIKRFCGGPNIRPILWLWCEKVSILFNLEFFRIYHYARLCEILLWENTYSELISVGLFFPPFSIKCKTRNYKSSKFVFIFWDIKIQIWCTRFVVKKTYVLSPSYYLVGFQAKLLKSEGFQNNRTLLHFQTFFLRNIENFSIE